MLYFVYTVINDRIRLLNTEQIELAQTSKQRKDAIAKARKAHHKAQTLDKKRLDAYVEEGTKEGLKRIKAEFEDVKNEGQAVDKAVQIALETLEEKD